MRKLAESPERSFVSVLAVDTVDSTGHIAGEDPDDAQELLDRIYRHLNGAVKRAGGLFVNFSGDGGVAVFGWPDSLEDHADRACEAAWLIQQPALEVQPIRDARGQPIRFRVGIHSGLIGLRRMDMEIGARLDPVGGTVHIAAALQKTAAADSTLISSKTLELCRSEQNVSPYDELQVLASIKAKAYRLGPRSQPPATARIFRSSLVGRLDEREVLRNALAQHPDECNAFAIIGEPGIGKSRLTAAVIDDAHASNITVLVFYGDSQKRTTPYSAMRSLIMARLSLNEAASDNDIIAALKDVGFDNLTSSPLGTVLLTKRLERDDKSSGLTLTQVARVLIAAFKTLTKGRPTLIVVEDLHLLDPESIHCLRLLAKEKAMHAQTLIVTGRPEAMVDAQGIADTVMRLAPLPRDEMRELARQRSPKGTPPQSVLERVLDRADGIPFVLEQIMLSIEADGAANVDLFPQSVQSAIHARLNRLPPAAKSCAQALSVLGEEVEIEFALRTLGLDREALKRDRADLEQLEIVDPATRHSIRFRHAIVAEACLATVPGFRRQELHRAAIATIKSIHADLGAQYERLAFHAEGARDDAEALHYLWLAALRARRSSASGSLYLMFSRAMRCIERIGGPAEVQFVDFLLMAFDSLQQIGEFRRLNAYLPRAMELAGKQNRRDKVCAALCHMSMVSWFEGRYAEGLEQSEKALAIANEIGNLPLTFAAKFMLASVLHGMADMSRAIGLQRELCAMLSGRLETARLGAAGIPGSIVRSFLCWFLMEVGSYEEGLTLVKRALEIAEQEREPYSEMLARLGLGRSLIKLKRNQEAVKCLEIAIALIERNGYNAILPHITGLLATALARSSQAERAVRMVEAWLESGQEELTGRLELYYLNAGYAEALFGVGKTERSLAAIEQALEVGRSIANPCLIVQGLGLRARLLRETGSRTDDVERDLAEQRELCRRHGLVAEA
jgi:class 3 adenylate cyclase/tetratricopeptide (TPR) repeat protein